MSGLDLWIEGTGGQPGATVTLSRGSPVTVGSHTYRYATGGLFGNGAFVTGTIDVEVDGVAAQIHFQVDGCPGPLGGDAGDSTTFVANVKRQRAGCAGCTPDTVVRTYALMQSTEGGVTYRFVDTAAPAGCGFGIDLMKFELR